MIICPSCGKEVSEANFCENCGAKLNVHESNGSIGIGSSIFNSLKNQMNKAATELLAIQSNFLNGNIIYKVNKIPNVQEKKVIVLNNEIMYFNNGSGFEKKIDTFTTTDNNFICFYIKNESKISNVININFRTKIMKVDNDDEISLKCRYNLQMNVVNMELFFEKLVAIKQETWTMADVNQMLFDRLNEIVINDIKSNLSNDGGLDLRDATGQINKYTEEIKNQINEYIKEYGLSVESFVLDNMLTDINEINKVLINYLYK